MRQNNNGRRTRGGRPSRRPGPLKSQTFDSNGPEVRIRGNAHQVLEKYQNLARDAQSGGDRVLAESYYQYAEHYYRIIHESTDPESPGSSRPHGRQNRYEEQGEEREEAARAGGEEGEGRQPRQPEEAGREPIEAKAVNGEAVDGDAGGDREGLERALGNAPMVNAGEEEGESAPAEAKAPRGNGQRNSRGRTRYRRQPRAAEEEEQTAGSHRRQFPLPAENAEPAEKPEGDETQDA